MADGMNAADLIAFEADIAGEFDAGHIRAPIHLSGGNEEALLEIFNDFRPGDWCFSTWRSHYHALLAGVPPEKVKAAIMAGRSITLCWPEHRFFSSAIVAGCCPIAIGAAWQIKRTGGQERVWCFLGDMASLTGLAYECANYASGHELPVTWVVEGNGKSVCTDTGDVWAFDKNDNRDIRSYEYDLPWPHAGAGVRVSF